MPDSFFDTIVAPITGQGPAAVAVVRLSGPEAWRIASLVFTPWPDEPEPRKAIYGRFAHGDDGLALPFPEGHSYTGDRTVEFSTHGSPASVRVLIDQCLTHGARMARPGEFTQRAFLNGRLDLTQAEAVRDTVEAQTDAQLRYANLNREGALQQAVARLRAECVSLLTAVEASVDFSDEIGDFDREAGRDRVDAMLRQVAALLDTAKAGRVMRHGLRIAIVGPPNAGKSSLMNALLGTDRSIVTEVPGTTRDFVEERADLDGVPCVLIDTAGLRDSDDPVESIGVQRSRAIATNSDLILYVYDATVGWTELDQTTAASFDRPVIRLANKCDLAPAADAALPVSAKTRDGFPALFTAIREQAGLATPPQLVINDRHVVQLVRAEQGLTAAAAAIQSSQPDDLISVCLQLAISAFGEITGETASPDIIDRIFHDFCIGK